MRWINRLMVGAACLLAAAACKKTLVSTLPTNGPAKTPAKTVATLPLTELQRAGQANFNYWSSKGKLYFKNERSEQNASFDLRMKKDSLIWLSVRVLSIEGLRVMITTDSLLIIDKMNRDQVALGLDSVSRGLGIQVDFALAQAAIVGNLPFVLPDSARLQPLEPDQLLAQHDQSQVRFLAYLNRLTSKLMRLQATAARSGNRVEANYAAFAEANGVLLPFQTTTLISYSNTQGAPVNMQFNLTHNKITLGDEPLEFPFTRR
ncbi:MAG: DUF4292 domain-containing protein [Bernardetiaceae bacterium]|jgi:hypothetical protein|nr:DUF4292 domain-containing protein [Bernardetiaceae bacterium]